MSLLLLWKQLQQSKDDMKLSSRKAGKSKRVLIVIGEENGVIKKIEVCINIKGRRPIYFLHVQKSKVVHGIHLSVCCGGGFLFCLLLDPVQTHKKTFASTEIGR